MQAQNTLTATQNLSGHTRTYIQETYDCICTVYAQNSVHIRDLVCASHSYRDHYRYSSHHQVYNEFTL